MALPEVATEVGVEVVAETTVTMVDRETEEGQRLLTPARVAYVAIIPPPPSRPSPNQSMIK